MKSMPTGPEKNNKLAEPKESSGINTKIYKYLNI